MANREGNYSPEFHSVFVETSLDTRLAILIHNDETISDFRDKFCKEHRQCFPQVGEINISALKVKRRGYFYHLSDSMNISKAFDGISTKNWFVYVDVARVEKGELVAIMAADQNCSNPELLDKKEIAIDSVLVDGHTKDLTLEEGLETEVADKKTKKRKVKSLDGKKSRKKSKIDLNHSAVATTPSSYVVDDSQELFGKAQVEVAMTESCAVSPRDKLDAIPTGAIVKDMESGEKNGISMGENQQTSDADMLCQEKSITINPELVDGHTRDGVKDVQANQTLTEALETDVSHKSFGKVPREKLDDLTGAIEQDLEKGEKTADLVKIDQEKEPAPTLELVDGHITSRDDVNESDLLSGAIEKDTGRGEGSRLGPGAADNLQTAELVTYQENNLEVSSGVTTGPATEKKRKQKKSSKDRINQSTAAASTTKRKIANEINVVPGNVDCVDTAYEPCPISRRENLGNPLAEAIQKENELGVKSVEDVGRDNIETDNLASYPSNQLEAKNGLTTGPASEKKRKRKKSSKDDINQSTAAATTTSREIVNEINEVPAISESFTVSGRGNLGNPLAEAIQKENEVGKKIDDELGIGKAIPSAADNILTNNFVSYPENQLQASSGLTTGPATEKKRRRKKSSKDHINQSTAAATTTSREIVNERETVSGSIDRVDATSEVLTNSRGDKLVGAALVDTTQNENEMGDKFADNVGSREGRLAADNVQVADLASTLPALVQESKTLDHIGKFTDENRTLEHEVAKDNGEIDADEANSVKSTKKKKSRKAKTPTKEETLVASGPQNVEPIKVVDGEGPDNVIRNVLDSLQQRNEAQENLDKIAKKSSKKSKKKLSLNIVEAQVLSVEANNAAQEVAPPINNPKDTDASLTSAKKDTDSDGSHLKKSIEVADNTEVIVDGGKHQKVKADMGDSFGSHQKDDIVGGGKKQDKVTGGAKSNKKEKQSLDLHPGGSIDGSLSSMKPKERNGRAQSATSGTSHLMSRLKNDRSESKVNHSITSVKGAVNNKKEAVKKSSNSPTVNTSKMNFFKDAEKWNSSDDESKTTSHVSTKTPSDSSSDDDSDVTSMSRKQGNNVAGGTNRFSGSLQDILRSSRSYKKAKLAASQSQPDIFDDEIPALDFVPDSQAN